MAKWTTGKVSGFVAQVMLLCVVAPGSPAQAQAAPAAARGADVPAPPIALLFAMAAAGVIWGRRLGARKDKD